MDLARTGRAFDLPAENSLRRTVRAAALLVVVLSAPAFAAGLPRPVGFANGFALEQDRVVPPPPPDLWLDPDSVFGANCYVVQFAAPIQRSWVEQLAKLGAQPLGYLPRYSVVVSMAPAVRRALDTLDFVAGSALFQPVFKLARELLDFAGSRPLLIASFPGHDLDSLASAICALGIFVGHSPGQLLHCTADRGEAARIARLSAVQWLQPDDRPVRFNNNAQWVIQTGWQPAIPPDSTGRRIWREGIRGQGVVVSLADAGINVDHDMFFDAAIPIRDVGVYLHHRKVIAYKLFGGVFGDAGGFHGTEACGTALGDDAPNGNGSDFDGMAPAARISFLDVGDAAGNIVIDQDELAELLDSTWSGSGTGLAIPQTSISWGWVNNGSQYRVPEAQTDDACWRYPELLTICAAGNDPRWIAHPAAAKNVLTVGACGNGIGADTVALFSGLGPAADGRIKPDLLAPGIELWTASGPGVREYSPANGTSFSAPAVNGACALIRQYLNDGWYPTGSPEETHRIAHPSSALLRSLAVVSADPGIRNHTVPDPAIGWGRMDLDSVLYFAGDARRLALFDETPGLASGEYREYAVLVSAQIPLRACLAWTDTAAAPFAARTLVNDLDLLLVSPSGQYYHGNRYFLGQSSPNPQDFDSVGNLECFRLNNPELGVWRLSVLARQVLTQTQPYAVSVTGACETLPGVAELPSRPSRSAVEIIGNPASGPTGLRCVAPIPARVAASVFDQTGRLVRNLADARLAAGTHVLTWNLCDRRNIRVRPGVYFVRVAIGDRCFTPKLVVTR